MAPYLTKNATFTHGSVTSRCEIPLAIPEIVEYVPGQPHVGAYASGAPRPATRFARLSGLVFEERGQSGSGTETPEGDIYKAAAMRVSGSTGYTFRGPGKVAGDSDIHLASGTPSGYLTPLATASLNIDTQVWALENAICELRWQYTAGQIPVLTADFAGEIAAADASATTAIRKTDTIPAVTVGPLPLPWLNSTITVTPVGGSGVTTHVVTEIGVALGNNINMRRSAGGAYGVTQWDVSDINPTAYILMEMPAEAANSLFEDYNVAGTGLGVSWTYLAGGATFKTITNTFNGKISGLSFAEVNGKAGYRIDLTQDPTLAAYTKVWS